MWCACLGEWLPHKVTYRQGDGWISQLDWALVSKSIAHAVTSFHVLQDGFCQSDHAPFKLFLKLLDVDLSSLHMIMLALLANMTRNNLHWAESPSNMLMLTGKDSLLQFYRTSQYYMLMILKIWQWEWLIISTLLVGLQERAKTSPMVQMRMLTGGYRFKILVIQLNFGILLVEMESLLMKTHQAVLLTKNFWSHFNDLLNPPSEPPVIPAPSPHIPILDDEISVYEVQQEVKRL